MEEIFTSIQKEFVDNGETSAQLISKIRQSAERIGNQYQIFGKNPSENEHVPQTANINNFKDIGNKLFGEKKYTDSIKAFTTLIFQSARTGEIKGFWNRSAALEKLEKYAECLEDLEAVIQLETSSVPLHQIYDRRGQCYLNLGIRDKALESFEVAKEHLEKTDLPEKLKKLFLSHLEKNKEKAESSLNHNKISDAKSIENSLSSKVETKYSKTLGRYLIAKEDFRPGEVIIAQSPISVYGNIEGTCHHCLKEISLSPFPSLHNEDIQFCSYSCFSMAHDSYHAYESHLLQCAQSAESEIPANIFLAIRLVTKLKESILGNELKENSENYAIVNGLMSHEEMHEREFVIQAGIRSVIVGKLLYESGFYGEKPIDIAQQEKIEHFLYFLQLALPHNVHSIYQLNGKGCDDIVLDKLGRGIYESALYLNHSCCANTLRFNRGNNLIIVANRSIKAGDRVCDCYGSHHFSSIITNRQKNLFYKYKFHCSCEACEGMYPSLNDLMSKEPALSTKENKILQKLLKKYQDYYKLQNYSKAISFSQKYIEELEKCRSYPHQNFEIGAIALKSSYWNMFHNENKSISH